MYVLQSLKSSGENNLEGKPFSQDLKGEVKWKSSDAFS
jgi:hypothetical protein